ncbi:uncharacterized membrane protein YraQ (UPF0718 family) [Clostridium pascui]|uniref:permease n=1 Tax=Clostridium pascui TaxID=46609 RepID=UPI00195829F4|nr:permease [Clostridium pascui]MBM7870327.1 uncharacterized membrane protein YraQ (UPF0718 family) [Clostridium pascui]
MNIILKRYKYFIGTLIIVTVITMINYELGTKVFKTAGYSLKEMAMVIPPIFVLLGLLDVWVPREIIMKYMGEDSGIRGIILAFLLGSAAAGPLYGAFPIAAVFMKKRVKFANILVFIGAWSTTKIPMFLFETTSLGNEFAITRLLIDIPGIIIIAYLLSSIVSKEEIEDMYNNADNL